MKKHLTTLALSLAFVGYAYTETPSAPEVKPAPEAEAPAAVPNALTPIAPMPQTQSGDHRFDYNQYGQRVESDPLNASVRNGITVFMNKEKGYRFWFDGRVQVDMAHYHNQKNGILDGPLNDPESKPYMPGGISLRRVRFAVKAEVNEDWYGEVDFNMANGVFGLQDAFIEYNGLGKYGLQFKLGNFKEDFSMEYTTSSRFVTFMERPMPITAFNFTRRLGFQAQWQQLDWLRISAGVTGQEIDNWMLRTNIEESMKIMNRGSGANFTGKAVLMPWGGNPDQGLHIGYNIQHRSGEWITEDLLTPDDGIAPDGRAWNAMRVDSRNSTAVNRTKYLDTRWFNGVKNSVYHGFELAGYKDGFRFGSEFIMQNAIMDETLPNFPNITDPVLRAQYAQNKTFYGYYIQAGYLLFGGQQRYNVNESEFTQPTRGRSWGDLEVLFRYDYLDLNNGQRDANIQPGGLDAGKVALGTYQQGGSGHNFTFGLNFWVNNNVRLTLNYMISQNDVWANGGGGINPSGRRNISIGQNADGRYTADPFDVSDKYSVGSSFNTLQMRVEIAF